MSIEESFIKFFLNNDTDSIMELLKDIDFSTLDYSLEFNQIIIYTYILNNIYYKYDKKICVYLNIVKGFSDILYYSLLKLISVKNNKYYNDIIISLKPKTKLGIYFHKYLNNIKDIDKSDITFRYEKLQKIKKEMQNEFSESKFNKIYFHKVDYLICKLNNNFKDNPKDFQQDKLKVMRYLSWYKIQKNFEKLYLICDILMTSKFINKTFIKTFDIYFALTENNEYYIEPSYIIKTSEEFYNFNTSHNIPEIKLGSKYNCLVTISYYLLLCSSKKFECKHKDKYIEAFKKYINDNINDEELDDDSDDILNTIYHNYYSCLSTKVITPDETKRKEYEQKLLNILEKKFNKNKDPSTGLDYIAVLFNKREYQKIINFYNQYKDFLHNTLKKSNLMIIFYSCIGTAFIKTNQVQTINELNELLNFNDIKNIVDNKYYENEIKYYILIQKYIVILEKYRKLILNIGFNIIENYDYKQDANGLKDEDDKMICPICYDTIEQDKITVIQCVKCNRYIGHILCLGEYINQQVIKGKVKCIICRHEY